MISREIVGPMNEVMMESLAEELCVRWQWLLQNVRLPFQRIRSHHLKNFAKSQIDLRLGCAR